MQIHEPIEPFTFLWWKGLLSCLILISLIFIFFTKKKIKSKEKYTQLFAYLAILVYVITICSAILTDEWNIKNFLPLHLCNFSYFICIILLLSKKQWMFEWSLLIAVPSAFHALLTPELYMGMNNWYLFEYYFMHGSLILVPLYLMFVMNYKLRILSWWKTLLRAQFTMILVYLLNLTLKTNYMFLIDPPLVENLLLIGEWPYYILYAELFAIMHVAVIYKISPKHI